jgi:hypothetical protein
LGWLLPPSGDGRPTHERRVNGKKSRFYIFRSWEREKTMETLETLETKPENELGADIQDNPAVSTAKNGVETLETEPPKSALRSPVSPVQKTSVETGSDSQTLDTERTSEPVSTVSSDSTPKTRLGNSNSENDPKVGDRVRYVGQSQMYRGSLGKVINAENDLYDCDFIGITAKRLTRNELEVI